MKDQEIERIAALIYDAPLGEYLGRDGAGVIAQHAASEQRLKDGEFLYRKGDSTSSFYIVTAGRLALVREQTSERKEAVVHLLEKGDLVGELSFIDQSPHELSVRALGDASVLSFHADDVQPLITTHPMLVYNFMRAIIRRAHHTLAAMGESQSALQQYIASGGKGRM